MIAVTAVAGVWRFNVTVVRAATADALQYLLTLGLPHPAVPSDGTFVSPQSVVYDAAGRLYVTDAKCWTCNPLVASDRLQVFGPDRRYLYSLQTSDGTPLNNPVGMALDASGQLLVADAFNDRVVLFSASTATAPGSEIGAFGVSGNYDPLWPGSPGWNPGRPPVSPLVLSFPTGVAIKAGTRLLDPADGAGRVAIVDNSNHRIVVLDAQMQPLYDFGGHEAGVLDDLPESMEYPWGVAIDAAGQYWVADSDNSRVQVFREVLGSDGQRHAQLVRIFGSGRDPVTGEFGSTPGDITRAYGLTFDTQGRLWVTDTYRNRLLRIDVTQDIPAGSLTACGAIDDGQNAHRCGIATSDGHFYEALVLGARGNGTDALFKYPSGVGVSGSGEVAVADTDNDAIQIFASSPLALAFAGPGTVAPGPYGIHQPVLFSVALKNASDVPMTVLLTPSAIGVGSQPFDGVFGGPTTGSIAPGATTSFAMTFSPNQPGAFTLVVGGSGDAAVLVGGHVDAGTLTLQGGAVAPAIGLSVSASPGTALGTVGDTLTLAVKVRNTGTTLLTGVRPAIVIDGPSGLVAPQDTPAALTLSGLAQAEVSYHFLLTGAGAVTLRVSADAAYVDPADPTGGTQHLTAVAPPVSLTISDDAKAPATTATLPPPGPSGWYNISPLPIHLAATDNPGGSGVAFVSYMIVEDNAWQIVAGSSADLSVGNQGTSHVRFHAKDAAGNVEADQTIAVKIDTVAPTMGAPQTTSALPPQNGWYRTDPTITFVAGDGAGGSGVAELTPPQTVSTNGAGQTRTGQAVDGAGNRSLEVSATVNVDKIAPTFVTCGPDRAPNSSGWYTANVTITCSAADQAGYSGMLSLRASCSESNTVAGVANAACTYSSDGVYTFLAEATDRAGNVARITFPIKVDKTAPAIVCATVSGGEIWPPNHKMVPWNTFVQVSDTMPGLTGSSIAGFKLTNYSSTEALNWLGDGNTKIDMTGWVKDVMVKGPAAGVTSGYVRSERSGPGTGRTYRLRYSAIDLAGNEAYCTIALIEVPHDQGRK